MNQEFLPSFGVQIDETGVSRLQQILEQNRTLAEELPAAFDRAREAVTAFFRELSESSFSDTDLNAARVTEEQQGLTLQLSLDFTKPNKELSAFVKSAGKALNGSVKSFLQILNPC